MINTLLSISGTEVKDAYNLNVEKSISENDKSSSFNCEIENLFGYNRNKFQIGDNVQIFAGKDVGLGSDLGLNHYNSGLYCYLNGTAVSGGSIFYSITNDILTEGFSGVSWGNGKIGSGISFAGSPNYISGAFLGINSQLKDFTEMMWLYPGSKTGLGSYLLYHEGGAGNGLGMFVIGGSLIGRCWGANGSLLASGTVMGGSVSSVAGSIGFNNWIHTAFTLSGGGASSWGLNSLWINGSVVGTRTISGAFAAHANAGLGGNYVVTRSSGIGGFGSWIAHGADFSGTIDEFRTYNYDIGSNIIQQAFNNGAGSEYASGAVWTLGSSIYKIFNGLIESVNYKGESNNEKIELSGRDYTARLMDVTVEPTVYSNLQAGSIIKDIVNDYVDEITTSGVTLAGSNIQRINFNHTPVYDAIKQLADSQDYTFWVDDSKDLHYTNLGGSISSSSLNNTNVLSADFKDQRDTLFNEIWVYGDKYLDAFKETTTYSGLASQGSLVVLGYKPHNVQVSISGGILQPGGIRNMNDTGSNIKYLVDYDNKTIYFTSGVNQGNNIPTSGNAVVIDYMRALPIVTTGRNDASVNSYGKRVKLIVDRNIKDPDQAELIMLGELDKYSDPIKEGNLKIRGIINIKPGEQVSIDLPNHNINNQTYDVISSNYDLNQANCQNDNVLKIKVNKDIPDISDAIKEILLKLKQAEAKEIESGEGLTRLEQATGQITIRQSGCEVWTIGISGGFILDSEIYGVLDSTSKLWGDYETGSSLFWSGNYV